MLTWSSNPLKCYAIGLQMIYKLIVCKVIGENCGQCKLTPDEIMSA